MARLSAREVSEKLRCEGDKVCYIDVRSMSEFAAGHVPGAKCVPLDQLEKDTSGIPKDRLVILGCLSGKRAERAAELLSTKGYTNILELEGGISAWQASGLPVDRDKKAPLPLIRQVLLTAGMIVLIGTLAGIWAHPAFLAIPVIMGAGLSFAGVTGRCGLAFCLEKMPWNRVV